jgi:hypothetical protein
MKKKTKSAKFDAVQIQNGALEQEGKFIAAKIATMRKYEAEADALTGVELKKADANRAACRRTRQGQGGRLLGVQREVRSRLQPHQAVSDFADWLRQENERANSHR